MEDFFDVSLPLHPKVGASVAAIARPPTVQAARVSSAHTPRPRFLAPPFPLPAPQLVAADKTLGRLRTGPGG